MFLKKKKKTEVTGSNWFVSSGSGVWRVDGRRSGRDGRKGGLAASDKELFLLGSFGDGRSCGMREIGLIR